MEAENHVDIPEIVTMLFSQVTFTFGLVFTSQVIEHALDAFTPTIKQEALPPELFATTNTLHLPSTLYFKYASLPLDVEYKYINARLLFTQNQTIAFTDKPLSKNTIR